MMLWHFYHSVLYIFKFATHNQLHSYGFYNIARLLDSAPGTALHLQCEVLMGPINGSRDKEFKVS